MPRAGITILSHLSSLAAWLSAFTLGDAYHRLFDEWVGSWVFACVRI